MALDEKIIEAVDNLTDVIRESDAYKTFEIKRKEVLRDPQLLENIKRTRVIRKQIASMGEYERNGDNAERLINEYDDLCDITGVHEFSLAELGVCALYQEVMSRIVSEFDVDLPDR